MTGNVHLETIVEALAEAVEQAEARWREIVRDPEAELPWSTHFTLEQETETGKYRVHCAIEFDRNVVEKVMGRE